MRLLYLYLSALDVQCQLKTRTPDVEVMLWQRPNRRTVSYSALKSLRTLFCPSLLVCTDICGHFINHTPDLAEVRFSFLSSISGRSQWPPILRRGSAAARLLGLRVRIPTGHGYFSLLNVVCCHVEVSATADHPSRRVLPTVVCLSVIRCNSNPPHRQ